jgi:hypothetical protein
MTPRTDSLPPRTYEDELPSRRAPVPLSLLAVAERRPRGVDRTALAVQVTLCIVVALLLFSVIALPKIRAGRARLGATYDLPTAKAH